jgi:hypothetical protein
VKRLIDETIRLELKEEKDSDTGMMIGADISQSTDMQFPKRAVAQYGLSLFTIYTTMPPPTTPSLY